MTDRTFEMHVTAPADPGRSRFPFWLLAALAVVALTAAILYAMGRVPICECGEIKLWHGEVRSSQNSQHVADWYTPSHIIHGFLFYGLFHLLARRRSLGFRLFGATVIEALWEIVENSPAVIERYRSATVALDYFGDSILNSVSDIGFMMLGFWLATRLPVWLIVAAALVFEILTAFLIRDNLTLNVLMLLWPLDAVKAWQNAG